MSKKFIVPISDINISETAAHVHSVDKILEALTSWHPDLNDFPRNLVFDTFDPEAFTEHGAGKMFDDNRRHKSLIVLSEHDRLPPNFETDFVNEHLRPYLTIYAQPDGSFKGILKLRELQVDGAKGHAHAPYGDDNRMEDVIFVPGTFEELTEAEYKRRYYTQAEPRFELVDA